MGGVGTGGELAQGDGRIADVGAAGDIGVEQFTEERAVGETAGTGECRMFGRAFGKTRIRVHRVNSVGVEGSCMGGQVGIGGFSPAVCGQETVDVAFTGKNDGVVVLVNIKAIEIGEEA